MTQTLAGDGIPLPPMGGEEEEVDEETGKPEGADTKPPVTKASRQDRDKVTRRNGSAATATR